MNAPARRAVVASLLAAGALATGGAGARAFHHAIQVPPPWEIGTWWCETPTVEIGDLHPDGLDAPPDVRAAYAMLIAAHPEWTARVTYCEAWMSPAEWSAFAPGADP